MFKNFMDSQQPHMHSIALAVVIAPLGLVLAKRQNLISILVLVFLVLFWLSFNGVLYFANDRKFSAYAYLVTNIMTGLYLFGIMPPRYGKRYESIIRAVIKIFVLFCLFFTASLIFPLIEYVGNSGHSVYEIKNKHVSLLFSNRLAMMAATFSILYIVIVCVIFAFFSKPELKCK